MSFQRSSSALGFGWEDMMRLNRKAKTTSHKIQGIEGALLYWFGPGAMMNRKAALDLAQYMRQSIYGQVDISAIGSQFKDLHPNWINAKAKYGLNPGMAMATERMVQSIQAIDSGGGKWKVGIKKGTSAQGTRIGVAGYAQAFEWGNSRGQDPRPIFMHYFMKWIAEKVPKLLQPFAAQFVQKYNDLKGEWEGVNYATADAVDAATVHFKGDEGDFDVDAGVDTFEQAAANLDYESAIEEEYYDTEIDDEFIDKSEWEETQQKNVFKEYEKFLVKAEKELFSIVGPVLRSELEDKNFWNGLSKQFQTDMKIWEKISKLFMKLRDLQQAMGR